MGPRGMSEEISELSRRISAAFDRMDQGLETLARSRAAVAVALEAAPEAAPETVPAREVETGAATPALLRALELAKASSDDWAERYRALQAQMGEETLAMAAEITRLTAELDAARAAAVAPAPSTASDDSDIDELTARIAEQEAELESLRAERAREAAELGEIIAALDPLVQEARHV